MWETYLLAVVEFLSTPSARRATRGCSCLSQLAGFLSTPSARRATVCQNRNHAGLNISIHALREEGDGKGRFTYTAYEVFLSTPSARRATCAARFCRAGRKFLSTPSARRATCTASPGVANVPNFYPRPPRGGRPRQQNRGERTGIFLSTPSARRATLSSSVSLCRASNFYPRPPRGGRPSSTSNPLFHTQYFYPRPPRGGRQRWQK